jgi:hypothetical protein
VAQHFPRDGLMSQRSSMDWGYERRAGRLLFSQEPTVWLRRGKAHFFGVANSSGGARMSAARNNVSR